MYILPSKQEREILFEVTRTCVLLKLNVCSMHVRFATQQRDTSGLINHQVKYFAKANSTFTIFLHRSHGRFIVYQFKALSLISNRNSKVTKSIPSSLSSSSSVMSPSSTTRLNSAEQSNLKGLPLLPLTAATQHHTKMMCHWIIHHLRTFSTEQNCRKDGSVSANFVANTLTQSEAIKTYTPYDITSSRPRKTHRNRV